MVDPLKCAPWMWKAVGFKTGDGSFEDTVGQVVVQPASFASWATGVYHPYKNVKPKDPCEDITCGLNARCSLGKCYCFAGFYPVGQTPDCGQTMTRNGCVCRTRWEGGIFNNAYYGCASGGTCKVDQNHPTYNTCKNALQKKGAMGLVAGIAGGSQYHSSDRCTWMVSPHRVPPRQVAQPAGV